MDSPTLFQGGLWKSCALTSTLSSLSLTCQLHWGVKVNGLAWPVGPAEKSWKRKELEEWQL